MITLGPQTFDVPTPRALRSFALQQRILPIAGRIVSAIVRFLDVSNMLKDFEQLDLSKLVGIDIGRAIPAAMPALGEIFGAMPPDELEALTMILLGPDEKGRGGATVSVTPGGPQVPLFGGKDGDLFDGLMQGRTWDTWRLLAHAVEVWYPDFFGRARALLARKDKGKPSEASTTSATPGLSNA